MSFADMLAMENTYKILGSANGSHYIPGTGLSVSHESIHLILTVAL